MAKTNILAQKVIYETDVTALNSIDIGSLINDQLSKLEELEKSVIKSMEAAVKAKDSANAARNKSAGFGKKKAAIEDLQSAGVDLASAVETGVETQKVSFEFQTMLANISKFLMWLGTSNIANNRIVIQELEKRLKGASEKELSDLAQQEVLMVIKQLKDQQDIFAKQEALFKVVKTHDQQLNEKEMIDKQQDLLLMSHAEKSRKLKEQLEAQAELDKIHSEKLEAQAEIDKLHDEQLRIQAEKDKWLEEKIQAQAEVDILHSEQLKIQQEKDEWFEEKLQVQAEVDKLHGEQLKNQEEKDKWLEEKLQEQAEIDRIHDEHFSDLKEQTNALNEEIKALYLLLESKSNNKISMIILAVAIMALIISIIHFII